MKTSIKLVVIVLALILVFSIMSTAFADSYNWSGTAKYGFDTSGMNRRISDKQAEIFCSDVSIGGYGRGNGVQTFTFHFLPRNQSYRMNLYSQSGLTNKNWYEPIGMIQDYIDMGYDMNGYISGRVDNGSSGTLYTKGTNYLNP